MKKTWILGIVPLVAIGCFWSSKSKVTLPPSQKTDHALARAILAGDTDTVTEILDANPDKVSALNAENQTPLHYAARTDNADMIKLLIKRGADINAINDDEETPAQVAKDRGASQEIIDLLQGGGGDSTSNSG
jgi:ankyrin repeat protein